MNNIVPIRSVIEEYIDFTGDESGMDKASMMKTALSVVRRLPLEKYYIHKLKVIHVSDYKGTLPQDFYRVVLGLFRDDTLREITKERVVEWVMPGGDDECDIVINLECSGCGKVECDCKSPEIVLDLDRFRELERPQWWYQGNPFMVNWGGIINPDRFNHVAEDFRGFRPMQPTNNPLHSDHTLPECYQLMRGLKTDVEYTIEGDTIRLNKKDGVMLLSYYSLPFEGNDWENTYIPDNEYVMEAIKFAIIEKDAYRMYRKTNDKNFYREYMDAMQLKNSYMGRARGSLNERTFKEMVRDAYSLYHNMDPTMDVTGKVIDRYDSNMRRLTRHL